MFTLADGCTLHDLTGIEEGFGALINDDREFTLEINVSAENIRSVFFGLAALVQEPTFAFIDVPSHRDVHDKLNAEGAEKRWADTYFRDKTSIDDLIRLYDFNPDLFIHDGMIKYGFACKTELDQVFVGKFKLFHVYTRKPGKYVKWLESQGILRKEPLRTVWDNFTNEVPGVSSRLTLNGEDAYGLVERLIPEGFFFRGTREEE